MRFREYVVSAAAVAAAREIGVYGDVAKRVARMARQAAPFTSEWANKRFHDYGLRIEGDTVVGVTLICQETALS